MTQTVKSVAIRMSTDGKTEVVRDYKDVGDAGKAAGQAAAEGADTASAAVDRQTAALQRQINAAKASATAYDAQAGFNSLLGVNPGPSKSASSSADVFREMADAEAQLQARSAALRGELDPLWAAQQKLGKATSDVDELLAAGVITTGEHAAALKLAKTEYDATEKSLRAMGAGVGFTTMQYQEFGAVAHRSFDSIAAGMPISRVMTMEGGRLAVALGSGPGGASGVMKLLGVVAGSVWTYLGLGVGVMGLLAVSAIGFIDSQRKIQQVLQGTGAASQVSLAQINALAEGQSKALDITKGSAREMDAALAGTGRASADSLGEAGAAIKAYIGLAGGNLKSATAEIAKIFADPAKGAAELNAKLNYLTPAELEHVKSLEAQGDKAGALKLALDQLTQAGAGLEGHMGAWAQLGHGVASAFGAAADATGEWIVKLLQLPGADAAANLADLQMRRRSIIADGSPSSRTALESIDAAIAKAQARVEALDRRTKQAATDQAATDLKAAVSVLDPGQDRIRNIQDSQKALRAAMGSPTKLAQIGLSTADANAALAAGDKEIANLRKREVARDAHAEALKRELAAMQANAAGSLLMAQGYLESDAAGAKAEATRKAVTDATKKGGDIDAFVKAQLRESAAQEAANAAKGIADLRDQVAAREAVNAEVAAGQLSSVQADQQLQLEAKLRPLVTAMTYADAAGKKVLADEIARLTALTKADNAALATSQFLKAQQSDKDSAAALQLEIQYVADLTGKRERLVAVLKAEQQAREAGMSPDEVKARGQSAGDQADLQTQLRKDQFLTSTTRSQQNSLDLTQAELGLIGKTQDEYDRVIDQLKMQQELKAQGIELTSKEAQDVLALVAANDNVVASLRRQQTAWDELKSAGDQFVDDVLNTSNWSNWGTFGKKIIGDLATEFEKLALINPLKNALFGEQNPTLGGVGGVISSLFGGGGGLPVPLPEFYASGTGFSDGNPDVVDEKGGELMNLPRGTTVVSNTKSVDLVGAAAAQTLQSMQKMAANNNAGSLVIQLGDFTVNAQGAGPSETSAIRSELASLRRGLPQLIVSTVNDQYQRRSIKLGRA